MLLPCCPRFFRTIRERPPPRHKREPVITISPEGAAAEQFAAAFLMRQSLTLLKRNYRRRFGESDLIMHDGMTEKRLRGMSHMHQHHAAFTVMR